MAEDLTEYLHEHGMRVRYMHSDIDTLERIEIIRDLRLGAFDVLVGINLLREGLDIPECALVAILDADKEGFLRSRDLADPDHRPRRAQRRRPVILYADQMTGSMERAIGRDRPPAREAGRLQRRATASRRRASSATSTTSWPASTSATTCTVDTGVGEDDAPPDRPQFRGRASPTSKQRMREAAADLDFEEAARLRDEIKRLRATELAIADDPLARQTDVEDKAGALRGRAQVRPQGQHADGRRVERITYSQAFS